MKRILLVGAILLAIVTQLFAQTKPYNVVFDLTTGDSATPQRVVRWINGILAGDQDAKIEVVFYGKALPMAKTAQISVASDVKGLAAGKNVIFAVCEQAMKIHNVEKNMLIPGVRIVADGMYELISRQADGYGYIKVTN